LAGSEVEDLTAAEKLDKTGNEQAVGHQTPQSCSQVVG
jgi:hypothetical protein